MTAEQLAVAILKADKSRNTKALENRIKDAEDLGDIPPASNEGIDPDAEAKAKKDAEMKAIIEAGAKGFSRK